VKLVIHIPRKVFEGDVFILYGVGCNKIINSPIKAKHVHVDLIDKHGQMTITMNVVNDLILEFVP